jgi:hypothetical protein
VHPASMESLAVPEPNASGITVGNCRIRAANRGRPPTFGGFPPPN